MVRRLRSQVMQRPTVTVLEHWPSLGGLKRRSSAARMTSNNPARHVVNRLVSMCLGMNRRLKTDDTPTVGTALLTPLEDVAVATIFGDMMCVSFSFPTNKNCCTLVASSTSSRFLSFWKAFTSRSMEQEPHDGDCSVTKQDEDRQQKIMTKQEQW